VPINTVRADGGGIVRLIGILGTILVVAAGVASAQTWDLTTHLAPSSPSSCPKVHATFELSLSGSELSIRTPAGQAHRGPVAPDGKVEVQYDSAARAIGRITIMGNTQTRNFALTASARTECIYALVETVPSEPASAYSGSTGDWALGRWNGLQVRNVQGVGIQSSPYSLIVEKQRNGNTFCRFGDPEAVVIVL
jgi:hypothetical protein